MKILKNNYAKLENFLLHQENFTFLKTTHSFHLVDPSPWPAVASLGAFMITSGGVLYMVRPGELKINKEDFESSWTD